MKLDFLVFELLLHLGFLFLKEPSLVIRHVRIKYRAEDIDFIVEILQLVKERAMFLLHLSYVDGISHVWWQPVIILVFPVGVFGNSALMPTARVATRRGTGKAVDISTSDLAILMIGS